MAVFFQSHTISFSGIAITGVAGKRIRVRRLLVTTSINTQFTLKQDLGGGNQAAITPIFEARQGGSALDLHFPEECPQTAVGESLGYVTNGQGDFSVWIEYDLAV